MIRFTFSEVYVPSVIFTFGLVFPTSLYFLLTYHTEPAHQIETEPLVTVKEGFALHAVVGRLVERQSRVLTDPMSLVQLFTVAW